MAGLWNVLQNIMLATRARGLDTCPQAAFTQYHRISQVLQLPSNEMVVCGMALGYADTAKVENTLVTERTPFKPLLNSSNKFPLISSLQSHYCLSINSIVVNKTV